MGYFSALKDNLWQWMCNLLYPSHKEYEEPKLAASSLFLSLSSGSRLWIQMCWGQVLIVKYFFFRLHSTNSLKASWSRSDEHPDLGSSLNNITPKKKKKKKKNCKPVSDLAVSNDTLAINTSKFFSGFCKIFIILKLPEHYMSNIHFQLLHFRGVRS